MAPLPVRVVPTAAERRSASAVTAEPAPECMTPPPASTNGRAARRSTAAAAATSAGSGAGRNAGKVPKRPELARGAAGFPVALGFRGQLATEKHGEAAGRLDIKHGGIIPLVNLVRFHAFAAGVTVSPTLDRIDAAARVGALPEEEAQALREADEVITRVRFERHAAAIESGRPADNLVDPGELSPIARTELREALLVVRRAQRRLSGWVPGPAGS